MDLMTFHSFDKEYVVSRIESFENWIKIIGGKELFRITT